jgi:2-oxoglutarate ferredoxin oxidoreductase subunit beta
MLARMSLPDYPVAMGVIRNLDSIPYESLLYDQMKQAKEKSKIKTVDDLLHCGNVFEVKSDDEAETYRYKGCR